jgi:hypothetical protein
MHTYKLLEHMFLYRFLEIHKSIFWSYKIMRFYLFMCFENYIFYFIFLKYFDVT